MTNQTPSPEPQPNSSTQAEPETAAGLPQTPDQLPEISSDNESTASSLSDSLQPVDPSQSQAGSIAPDSEAAFEDVQEPTTGSGQNSAVEPLDEASVPGLAEERSEPAIENEEEAAPPEPEPLSPTRPRLQIGSAYYPEHWPEERWREDIRLMKEAGLTVARMGEFAW